MIRATIRVMNALLSIGIALCLALVGAYAAFALWDNERVYAAAADVRTALLQLKPTVLDEEGEVQKPSFEELLAINPDVCAWITMDNTSIDYPVLQGTSNLSYINTDVYGNFALAGSIFLDSRCDNTFQKPFSLLYGHHMEHGYMFGDLDLYKDKLFFDEKTTGTLLLLDGSHSLDVLACMVVGASDGALFHPLQWEADIDGLIKYISENALYIRQDALKDALGQHLVALSTCSSEFTDARTVVICGLDLVTSIYTEGVEDDGK